LQLLQLREQQLKSRSWIAAFGLNQSINVFPLGSGIPVVDSVSLIIAPRAALKTSFYTL